MRCLIVLLLFVLAGECALAQEFRYPISRKTAASDTFYTQIIRDPYRWLERAGSLEVKSWVDAQNKASKKVLNRIQARQNQRNIIDKYAYSKFDYPKKKGKYYYTIGDIGDLSQLVLAYKSKENGEYKILVDPNFISRTDQITLKGYYPSPDSEYLAFSYNRNGSDWREVQVVNLNNRNIIKDHLDEVKFSNVIWKDEGFYYSKYQKKGTFDATSSEQIFYHHLGTDQSQDSLVFRRKNPAFSFDYFITQDQRYFILKETDESSGKMSVYFQDFENPIARLLPLFRNLEESVTIIGNDQSKLFARTSFNSNVSRIVQIDLANPSKWTEISPSFPDAVMMDTYFFKNRIISLYLSNLQTTMIIQDFQGHLLNQHTFPLGITADGFFGDYDDNEISFDISGYTVPLVVFKLNLETFEQRLVKKTEVGYSSKDIKTEVIQCKTKDGAEIPIMLVYQAGMKKDGENPLILTAYGGFGAISLPSFDPGIIYHVKRGGVFAFAAIRGGGEKGFTWAMNGIGSNKPQSITDFISVSEFLIEKGYTQPQKLGITGASNGGLVVAASAIQRPDLFKVVVPQVGAFDMLRFEKFTVGNLHTDEYGTVTKKAGFERLKSYSPLHNIAENHNYPSMLIMTSENDDRVPPFHSYKFAARLQNRKAQRNPIFLRVEKNAGHSGASTLTSYLKEISDQYGFMLGIINGVKMN